MEADKKNLLTLPTDPNKMYIKSGSSRPSAEVIVYPMGQLLNPPRGQGWILKIIFNVFEKKIKIASFTVSFPRILKVY